MLNPKNFACALGDRILYVKIFKTHDFCYAFVLLRTCITLHGLYFSMERPQINIFCECSVHVRLFCFYLFYVLPICVNTLIPLAKSTESRSHPEWRCCRQCRYTWNIRRTLMLEVPLKILPAIYRM